MRISRSYNGHASSEFWASSLISLAQSWATQADSNELCEGRVFIDDSEY